ncbi:HET-domain-containing protein [Agrocybe pediades]|nr:HET-domain-containing protein [Agrocybe pediades]
MNHDCQTVEIPQLPTRVVDCSDPENPKLIPGAAINAHYAALSYVWGQAQPHSTSSATIQAYMLRIDISILPQTIVDAILTAHSLGIRYLWTDTLCIIQDSPEDKNQEISRMCDIYQKAFVTIIASCAKKAGDGFLHNRKRPVSMSLPFWTPSGALGTMQVQDQERSPQNEPVDKRAWCFQERLLASRALIYASHTMQFQCRQGIQNVGGGHNFWTVKGRDDLRIPIDKIGERKAWHAWKSILAEYSRRSITSPADKLVALSGVAQAFQSCWDEDTDYIGGLWKNTLTQDLLWHRSGASTRVARPITYRAPSWSWAATDGPTDGGGWPGPTESLVAIRKCQVTPRISDLAFGEIQGGTLEIEAVVRSVSWGSASLDSNDVPLFELCDGKNKEIGFVYHDCNDPSEQREGYAVVLAELNKAVLHHLVGIIVIPVIGMGDTYIRVGFFDVHAQIVDESYADEPFCDIESWLKTVKKHITVV